MMPLARVAAAAGRVAMVMGGKNMTMTKSSAPAASARARVRSSNRRSVSDALSHSRRTPQEAARDQSVLRKCGCRFSEKITLRQNGRSFQGAVRPAMEY
jgi:hypothetical protein